MRTIIKRIVPTIVLTTFCGFAATSGSPKPTSFNGAILVMYKVVIGHPFSAQKTVIETVKPPLPDSLSSTRTYSVYRDSQGRTVTTPAEASSGYNPDLIEFDDPVSGFWYVLDTARHIAHRSKMPQPLTRPAQRTGPESQDLGSQYMFGVLVNGSRAWAAGGLSLESWISPDLQLRVYSHQLQQQGERIEQITNLQLTEPPATLFQIPTGFTVVDETEPFSIK